MVCITSRQLESCKSFLCFEFFLFISYLIIFNFISSVWQFFFGGLFGLQMKWMYFVLHERFPLLLVYIVVLVFTACLLNFDNDTDWKEKKIKIKIYKNWVEFWQNFFNIFFLLKKREGSLVQQHWKPLGILIWRYVKKTRDWFENGQ